MSDVAPPTPPARDDVIHAPPRADGFEQVGSGRALRADVVIVGSGPGGSAAARALAEAGLSVVILEEGPPKSRFRPNYANTARYHMQEAGGMTAHGDSYIPVAAGRGVGGGSLINSALCFRAPEEVLDGWAKQLDDGAFTSAAMAPIYDELAEILGIGVAREEHAGENNRLIARGAAIVGYPGGYAPRNTPRCVGCGACNYGCPSNGKATVNLTLLPRAVAKGALIQADTKVSEVLVEGGRAVGVRGRAFHPDTGEAGGEITVRADRVLLSAGAIGTPRLLWHSGLAAQLGPVGEGLHIHPGGAVLGLCEQPIYLWRGATQGSYFTIPDMPGILPHAFTAPPEATLVALGWVGPKLQEGIRLLPYLCGLIALVSDKGFGQVRSYPDGRADITYKYDDHDLERTRLALVECARVLFAGGATEVMSPIRGLGRYRNVEDLRQALADRVIQDLALYSSHPMSSCRMSADPETGPLRADGRMHRLEGLYVADASVFPTSLGVNPQYTTMAMATVLARKMVATG